MKTTKTLAWAIVDKKGKVYSDKFDNLYAIYKRKNDAESDLEVWLGK